MRKTIHSKSKNAVTSISANATAPHVDSALASPDTLLAPTTSATQNANLKNHIIDGAMTAFADDTHRSSKTFRPRFVHNNHKEGQKISTLIEEELRNCSSFDFSVAFITDGGIAGFAQTLKELERRGIPGRILTTDYLSFSEPKALERLNRLQNIEVRMYRTSTGAASSNVGFHTKGYIFNHADGYSKMLVGSANLTATALNDNKEWNIAITSTNDGELLKELKNEFELLWNNSAALADYIETYRELYTEKKQTLQAQKTITFAQAKLEPNSMQIGFISNLDKIVEGGGRRALLISATGTGKTYASAFAVRHLQMGRVLFLVHRGQILNQSLASYHNVLGGNLETDYGKFTGGAKETSARYVFATVQTLSKTEHLRNFARDTFDIIVIDEVHRAGAESYLRIMDYFMPRLFLGMTASPERRDAFNIYELFDNNIAYEIRLQKALEENLLCPFHYFGITDIAVDGAAIDDKSDFNHLVSDQRIDHIIRQVEYFGHSGPRVKGLMFCSCNDEACEISRLLNERGYHTLALSGKNSQEEREHAIARLIAEPNDALYNEYLDYILTVDIFNEGIDIPPVNQVVMLRPTESPVIFVQQLGRGLRLCKDKEYVVILDFIGNYENNYMIPLALSGDRSRNKDSIRKFVMEGNRTLPGQSSVHFDKIARDKIFESIDSSTVKLKELREAYENLKYKIGHVPTMQDFATYGELDPMLFVEKKRSYYRFLAQYEPEFKNALNNDEHLFIEFVSNYLANGMRPHELLVLRDLIEHGQTSRQELKNELATYYTLPLSDNAFASTIGVLDKSFLASVGEVNKYDDIHLVSLDEDSIEPDTSLLKLLGNSKFKAAFSDVVNFGLDRFDEKYEHVNEAGATSNPFKLYEKYTRKDACRLLNWPHNDSSTIYGYQVKYGTCPIFVTYNKQEDISASTQYEDRFIDKDIFSWMTRSRVKLDSDEAIKIAHAPENGLTIHLFIKKSDSEGSDFYYIGKVDPFAWTQQTIKDDHGNTLPIVNFKMKLEHSLRDDIYDYLEGSVGSSSSASQVA
jgi:superfamily II DNA or RNA helicase